MTWGIPTQLFLQIHVALSLVALVAGLMSSMAGSAERRSPL